MAPSHVFKYIQVVSVARRHIVASKLFIWDELQREGGGRVTWQLRDFVLCLGYGGGFCSRLAEVDEKKAQRAHRFLWSVGCGFGSEQEGVVVASKPDRVGV